MSTITRILTPTDFSDHAHDALSYAAVLSQKFEAPLVLLHVYASAVIPVPGGYVMVSAAELADLRLRLTEGLDLEKQRAIDQGAVAVETALTEGTPWQQIVSAADEHDCDLIVIGTHGRTGLSHLIIGSVAEKVVRKAPCPVLTVGPRIPKRPATPTTPPPTAT
jgi:nucleotide-binding universal stress UspA family protein